MATASRPELKLDWCSHAAAKYAVEHWHYSQRMPVGRMMKVGVWEDNQFIGTVLFARGNTPTLGSRYGITMLEVCELVRIALARHATQVSRIVAIALTLLKRANQGLRLVLSFADPAYNHHGGIYQAGGWIYTGLSEADKAYFYQGRWQHSREIRGGAFGKKRKLGDYSCLPTRVVGGKHRYLYPLDAAMRTQIESLGQPYPKRAASILADVPADQAGEGRAALTAALPEKSYATQD